jgi:hypothetical protein
MSMPSSLLKEQKQFVKRQAEAAAFHASNEKRQKVEKSTVPKVNRPKSTMGRPKLSSGKYRNMMNNNTTIVQH